MSDKPAVFAVNTVYNRSQLEAPQGIPVWCIDSGGVGKLLVRRGPLFYLADNSQYVYWDVSQWRPQDHRYAADGFTPTADALPPEGVPITVITDDGAARQTDWRRHGPYWGTQQGGLFIRPPKYWKIA